MFKIITTVSCVLIMYVTSKNVFFHIKFSSIGQHNRQVHIILCVSPAWVEFKHYSVNISITVLKHCSTELLLRGDPIRAV